MQIYEFELSITNIWRSKMNSACTIYGHFVREVERFCDCRSQSILDRYSWS